MASESSCVFCEGDRWAAIGDSITHTGSYHAWVYLYHLTRFPARALELVNCGIAGDTAAGGVRRLPWDIRPTQPTVATVMFGMNDVGLALYANGVVISEVLEKRRGALHAYRRNMNALVAALQQVGTRVVLLTPAIFDQFAALPGQNLPGLEVALATCAEFVERLGAETGASVVDFHGPMHQLSRELQRADPAFTLTSADRMHPGPAGHLLMASLFLKAQQAPAEVSRITIDGETLRVMVCRNGILTKLCQTGARGLAFTWQADALPFPIDPACAPALRWVPFMADFNQEFLQVTALSPGNYTLRIDETTVATFSAEALACGVNLAEYPQTPQYQQAFDVSRLVQEHRRHGAETLRNLALVEHQTAPEAELPCTFASIRPRLETRLAMLRRTEPPGSNLLRIYELYPSLKVNELEHRVDLVRLAVEARRIALPIARHYELIKLGK